MPGYAGNLRLSVLGCAHMTSVIYLGDSLKRKGFYLPCLESRRTYVFYVVPGPVARVHIRIAPLMKRYYPSYLMKGKTSVSLDKSSYSLKATNESDHTIPKHWRSLKVMTRKPAHGLSPVLLVCGNKDCRRWQGQQKERTQPFLSTDFALFWPFHRDELYVWPHDCGFWTFCSWGKITYVMLIIPLSGLPIGELLLSI